MVHTTCVYHCVFFLLALLIFLCDARELANAERDSQDFCLPPPPDYALERSKIEFEDPMADILIAVDTSGSMMEESVRTAREINKLGQYLQDSGIDYRLVLVGKCVTCGSTNWLCVKPPLADSDCALQGPRFRQVASA